MSDQEEKPIDKARKILEDNKGKFYQETST